MLSTGAMAPSTLQYSGDPVDGSAATRAAELTVAPEVGFPISLADI